MTLISVGGQGPGQMGGHAGGGDERAKAPLPGLPGKLGGLDGGAVGGVDVDLKGHAEGPQGLRSLPDDGQIAGAAHDDGDFLHKLLLLYLYYIK